MGIEKESILSRIFHRVGVDEFTFDVQQVIELGEMEPNWRISPAKLNGDMMRAWPAYL
jgi:hypothetical protein